MGFLLGLKAASLRPYETATGSRGSRECSDPVKRKIGGDLQGEPIFRLTGTAAASAFHKKGRDAATPRKEKPASNRKRAEKLALAEAGEAEKRRNGPWNRRGYGK